jgi:hypothetical protein
MDIPIRPTPPPEFVVPKPFGAVVGAFVLTGFILFFVLLAVQNLLNDILGRCHSLCPLAPACQCGTIRFLQGAGN